MNFRILFLNLIVLLLYSCDNTLDDSCIATVRGGGNSPLEIITSEIPFTKSTGQIFGSSLSSGSELGVFVTSEEGTLYNNKEYNNLKFVSVGTGVDQAWSYDEHNPILLNGTNAKIYAYYPRQSTDFTLDSIVITNDGTDWMYTPTAATGLNYLNPKAILSMIHVMSIIQVKVILSHEYENTTDMKIGLEGTGWATSAILDLEEGKLTSYKIDDNEIVADNITKSNPTTLTHDFWVISNEQPTLITVKVKLGNDYYKITTPVEQVIERGMIYNYTLKVNNNNWHLLKNGVYAIDNEGNPVDYEIAVSDDKGIYKRVAIVMRGKAFEIANTDASDGTSYIVDDMFTEDQQSIFRPYYVTISDGSNGSAYLMYPNSTYTDEPHISTDISTWNFGALSDLDGKENTQRIMEANVTMTDIINNFNNGPNNQGNTSWYLPAAGQLSYIFMNHDKINHLLDLFGGVQMTLSDAFWSSTVRNEVSAWRIGFHNGLLSCNDFWVKRHVRLVKDL